MTTTELTMLGLLIVIASQTSYTTYRTWKRAQQTANNAIYIDTSVLMDGRIVSIAETGFIPGKMIIPRSVIGEMQFLADNADSEKRERARSGLDVAKQLQSMDNIEVEILQDGSKAEEGVDERLLKLAKQSGGILMTIDFNLNKVAQVEGIVVLNVNDLARQLRMVYLPGDKLDIELSGKGSDNHQAVGHLEDGTMVVVEQSSAQIGQRVKIEIIRSLQTAAGKMMFAKRVDESAKTSVQSGSKSIRPEQANVRKKFTKPNSGRSVKLPKVLDKNNHKAKNLEQSNTPRAQSRKPKTSAQREASLIDLVENQ